MKLFAGYQMCATDGFLNSILAHKEDIQEVYFSWDTMPSGRSIVGLQQDLYPWEAAQRQREELAKIANAGIGLNLLLNANCYGGQSLARSFFQSTGDLVDFLQREMNLVSVTTTSPVIGRFLRENFPDLDIRASVNMEIGTPEGMDYLSDSFNSYYVKRELNRDMEAIRRLRQHADETGKKLYMLANSGCLNNCSARQFHDNLVAHEQEIAKADNAFTFHSACRNFLGKGDNKEEILRLSNWVRPEDLHNYEGLVDGVKIATRTSPNPISILEAYARGSYAGNILDLLEPNYAALFYPTVLNNRAFPEEYFNIRHNCKKNCASCGYCKKVYSQIAETIADIYMSENDIEEDDASC